jgi:hypothetical protein
MKTKDLLYYFFGKPENDIMAIQQELQVLRKKLETIAGMQNKVEAIVLLFQTIGPLYDENPFAETKRRLALKKDSQLTSIIEAFDALGRHFVNAGRDLYGMNRTKKGEIVTNENVFLGDVFGIWTMSTKYWLENQKRFETEDSGVTPKQGCGREYISVWYVINDHQAGGFIKSHTEGILTHIDTILNYTEMTLIAKYS